LFVVAVRLLAALEHEKVDVRVISLLCFFRLIYDFFLNSVTRRTLLLLYAAILSLPLILQLTRFSLESVIIDCTELKIIALIQPCKSMRFSLVWQIDSNIFTRNCNREWWGAGVVICLERDADLHMIQLMPLPLTVSCFSKIQIGFTFLVPAHPGSPRQRAVKWVCVYAIEKDLPSVL